MKRASLVAVVGRPNVGKSTLFNRLTRGRRALVHKTAGVTRDVQRGVVEWTGHAFELIDTGGLFSGIDDPLVAQVEARALKEATRADVLLFVVDAEAGLIPSDFDVAKKLRATHLPVLLVVNKAERPVARSLASEFHRLGFDTFQEVSALHGDGTGDLLDEVVKLLPRTTRRELHDDLRLAIAGVPNVGKSSLVNAIVGEEANIVDSRPGTTRDAIDVSLAWHKKRITLVDTAGIRRKARTSEDLDILSTLKSLEAIERCDVAIVMLDATRDVNNQDVKVASYPHNAARGVVVCFNKWDAVKKADRTYVEIEKEFRRKCAFLDYAPVLFISAKSKQRVDKVLETAWRIKEERERRIPTSELNRVIARIVAKSPPPFHGGGNGKIFYATQVDVAPPTITLFVNRANHFGRYYLRYINNQLRAEFGFEGTLIRIELAERRSAKDTKDSPRARPTRRTRMKRAKGRKVAT
ncbi:MAG TPA: ribosome biogenesis GTPase Der [Candidatus Krumholzibacteria bacterium]|nr:ribosome biogenesis GTPase Der [Candidatus Krumholzibacteria bacterium]